MAYANRVGDFHNGAAAVAQGRLGGEQSRPTIHDVARATGVSIMTVSRALNGGSCRPRTRQAVLEAARQLGYEPNAAAQALASRKRRHPAADAADSAVSMPQVWQSYAEMMLRLMRPQ